MNLEKIIVLTEKLLKYNQQFVKIYEEVLDKEMNQDFETVIKPFVNEVKAVNEEWKDEMKLWLKEKDFRHLHLKQIDTTSEHIGQLSIQSFFSATSRYRFINANRTVEYFLLEILKEIRK